MYIGQDTLKSAAWILITLGVLETLLLVYAINSGGSFSGGAFLYCLIGVFLLKKDKTAYKLSQFIFTLLFLFVPAAVALMALMAIQVFTSTDIPLSWEVFNKYTFILIIYIGVVCYLVLLLHHPNTREKINLDKYNSSASTLFIPKKRVIVLSIVLLLLGGLIVGPHLYNNPYKIITNELSKNTEVSEKVGKIETLELLVSNVTNWNVITVWNIQGTEGNGVFSASLDANSELNISDERESHNQSNCAPNKALNEDARIARAC